MLKNIFMFLMLACFLACQQEPTKVPPSQKNTILYRNLVMLDLDQVSADVDKAVARSKTEDGSGAPLQDALFKVLARPNDDGMIDKVIGPLRSELQRLGYWETALTQLVQDSIDFLKDTDKNEVEQVTHLVALTNLLSELKPKVQDEGFERTLVKKIADAKIQVSKKAKNEVSVGSMKVLNSPSKIAQSLYRR